MERMYGRIFDGPSAVRDVEAMLRVGARWAKPGQTLPIWDGEVFNGRVTFQHRGPADRVKATLVLTVGAVQPMAIGDWMSVPADEDWATYTVTCGPGSTFTGAAAIGTGRIIDGDMILYSESRGTEVWRDMVDNGFVTQKPPAVSEYSVLPAGQSVEVWAPRG